MDNKRRLLLALTVLVFLSTLLMIFMPPAALSSITTYQFFSFAGKDKHIYSEATRLHTHGSTSGLNGTRPSANSSKSEQQGQSSPSAEKQQQSSGGVENASPNGTKPSTNSSKSEQQQNPGSDAGTQGAQPKPAAETSGEQKQQQPSGAAIPKPTPEPTNRPLVCENCFFSRIANVTFAPEVCSAAPDGTTPEMLLMITSSLDGAPRRQAIRDTWASATRGNTARVRHVFLLGTRADRTVREDVREEAERHKDMLVSDFVDVYGNLTYKTMVGLHYLVDHCGQAKFFLKTDQDMYIFVDHLLNLARSKESTLRTALGGACYQTGKPWRDPKTKYYASIRSYPQSTYPGFCSGTGYIGTTELARKVVATSPNIPFFHLEDVYLALVLRHVGYKLVAYRGFAQGAGVCKNPSMAKQAMTIHEVSPDKMREMWNNKCGV